MSSKPEVLISCHTFEEVLEHARAHFTVIDSQNTPAHTPAELRARAAGMQGILLTGTDRVDQALLNACASIRAVAISAVGYNTIDVDACTARGVLATNTPGILDDTTADLGFALILAAARRLGEAERYVRAGRWTHWQNDLLLGRDVHHAALGIVGMGRIGQALARRARGFDMKVCYHNRSRVPAAEEAALDAQWLPLDELLANADIVCLCLPYSSAVHHLIGAREIALMKPTALLVNIARGGIVDDAALADALAEHRIAGAGLDVFEGEPALNPRLLGLDNVVMVPHIGSATRATRVKMGLCAVNNLRAALSGETPPNLINPQSLAVRRAQ